MIFVIDASVATKWFFNEAGEDAALEILRSGALLLAPDLIVPEVCNAAWRKVLQNRGSAEQAREAAIALPGMFRELIAGSALAPRALEIAMELKHPVYDCLYIALAEVAHAELVTADEGFANVALRAGISRKNVRLISQRH